jgi:hypothetical protein
MKILSRFTWGLSCTLVGIALAQAPSAPESEGLVPVKARSVDKAYLLPGADFRPYKRVLLKSAEVAFQKDWLRDMNGGRARLGGRVSADDAGRIVDAARSGFDEIWAEAFRSSGYEVVAAPGEDVLQVSPSVVDLYVNAPDTASMGITRTYTMEAGEATLRMDVRDSRTGTLLGRVSDHRHTVRSLRPRLTDGVTNRAEFEQLFEIWARIAAHGLQDLKAMSPLPETLRPGEKILPG